MEVVSLTISESASTDIALAIFESTGVVCTDKSMYQLWKLFCWWFLNRRRLRFPWLFLSQQGLCVLMNPCVGSWSYFCDEFWGGRDSVFLKYFRAHRDCVRWRIQASALQAVLVMISLASTSFSLTICESTRAVCADESMRWLLKLFLWWILRRHGLNSLNISE